MKSRGFTIVELLIVIVVIAILAAITIVAYNGIQNRANDTTVQSDIRGLAMKVVEYQTINGQYPTSGTNSYSFPGGITYKVSQSSFDSTYYNLYYCVVENGSTNSQFSISARSKSGKIFVFRDGAFQSYSGSWSGSVNICTNSGISTGSAGFEYHMGYRSDTPAWSGWTNG